MNRLIIILNLILIFSSTVNAADNLKVRIDIKKESFINANFVSLNDIATFSGKNSKLISKLSKIKVLKRLPNDLTKSITLRQNTITAALRQNKVNLKNIDLVSSGQVNVFRKYKIIDKGQVYKMIENIIFNELMFDREYVKLSRHSMSEVVIPDSPYIIKVKDYSNNKFKRKVSFGFDIFVNKKLFKSVIASVFMELIEDTVVFNKNLSKGHIITHEDISYKKVLERRLIKSVYSGESDVLGKIITRNVKKGDLIRKRDVKEYFPVQKGTKVLILAESPYIKVSCDGVANERGKVGDMIKVLNVNSKKMIFAKILDSNIVTVEF